MGITQYSLDSFKIKSCTDSTGEYIDGSDVSYNEYIELTDFIQISGVITGIVAVFVMAVCVFFTYIWFVRRYNEFAIRKAFGQRPFEIFMEVFRDLFFLYCVGIVVGVIVFVAYACIRTKDVVLISKIPIDTLLALGVMALPIVISSLLYYIKIKKLSPVMILSKRTF